MRRANSLTDEQRAYLLKNYTLYGVKELTEAFNKEFGTDKSWTSIKAHLARLDVRRSELTKEEMAFIFDHLDEYTYEEFSNILLSDFNHKLCASAIRRKLKRMGVNKRKHCPERFYHHNATSKYDIGETRKKKYETLIRLEDKVGDYGNSVTNWTSYGRYLWEQIYGPLPDDVQVIHLNGDTDDFSLDNLYPVTMQQHAFLTNNQWHGLGEITRTGLMINELQQVLNKKGE